MALDEELLAKDLWDLNGEILDGDGNVVPPTDAIKNYAKGFILMVKASTVVNIAGSVTASAPPGSPTTGGSASAGKIVGLLGFTMSAISADPVVAPPMTIEADTIATYLMAAGLVNFDTGSIEGISGETANPGPLATGKGSAGKITGLDGGALATLVASSTGQGGPKMKDHYQVMMDHLMDQGEVTYIINTVLGSMAGGVLVAGLAAGGTIL